MKYEKLNIEITNEHCFDNIIEYNDFIQLYSNNIMMFRVYPNSIVDVTNSLTVIVYDKSKVDAYANSKVVAHDESTVYAYNGSRVEAFDTSTVYAYSVSTIHAYDSSIVYAHDGSTVDVYEFSCIYVKSHRVTINTINHFGAIIKQVHKVKKDILVYKKLKDDKIATLKLVKGQTFQSKWFNKCRIDRAFVVSITNIEDTEKYQNGVSEYDKNFIYEVGKEVIADIYDKNIEECSNGIHFFLTREKAEKYNL
jgi:hypothetical protein